MPWWIALVFSAYATHMLWQVVSVSREHNRHTLLWWVPLLLMKLTLLAVAASYWYPEACNVLKAYNWRWLYVAAAFAYFEASLMRHVILQEIEQMKKHPYFDAMMVAQVLASVVLPLALLFVAYQVMGQKQCAGA